MRSINKLTIVFAVLLVVGVFGNMWYTNRGPFQGSRVAGVPSGHLRVEHHDRGHLDLLLSHRGGVSYNFFGQRVNVYIAYYERDELVLHELVSGIASGDAHEISGTTVWGITSEEGARRELRVMVDVAGASSSSYFDFTQIDFEPGSFAGGPATMANTRIEHGKRYVLHIWQTGHTFWVDGDVFNPERLRENEKTAVLYIVFE
ncbi:MAG: hypothetical protein FWE19_06685 [Oscillospiraceae bacterium]|nr:hypothetical protein [Oscillospiraceae bacterium]